MSEIVWLASYPKSGNTWCRLFFLFLTNRIQEGEINHVGKIPICSSKHLFDQAIGADASDFTHEELEGLRPQVYRWHAENSAEKPYFMKVHDAFSYIDEKRTLPLIPPSATRGAIYIIRNPLDVVVSSADFFSISLDRAIDRMSDPATCLPPGERVRAYQLKQALSTWSGHVQSWTQAQDIDVHVMRYEDMQQKPLETFGGAAAFCGLRVSAYEVDQALSLCRFEKMKQAERKQGFIESPGFDRVFFNRGRIGSWRNVLSEKQVNRVLNEHGEIMKLFGYLDGENRIMA